MDKTYYNPHKHFIFIDDKIKTDISYFQYQEKIINIKFKNSKDPYSYRLSRIRILKNPKTIDIEQNILYCNSSPLYNIKYALDFWNWCVNVFLENGEVISSDNIEISNNPLKMEEIKKVINYFKLTINDLQNEEEMQSYLKNEYGKLEFINPSSVLYKFLLKKSPNKTNLFNFKELIYPFNFNLSQKKALENIYNSHISVIEWPPWTWKTQTILNIIANLAIMQNKTIAIISNNNSAISNVKEKLEKDWYDFFTALLWKKENKENFFSNIPKVKRIEIDKLENYTSKLEEISNLMEINNEKVKLEAQLSSYILEQKHFEEYFKSQEINKIFWLPFFVKSSDKIVEFLAENSHNSSIWKNNSLFYKIKIFIKYWFIDFKKLKNEEINIILDYQRKFYELKIEELKKEISSLDDKLLKNNYETLILEYTKYSRIKFNEMLNSRFKKIDDISFTNSDYFKQFNDFIKRFPVILSTTYAILNSIPKGFLFDYLIIDESSQVDLISWALALSCCRNIVIVWDTKQLSHIVNSKDNPSISWTIDSCFNYHKHNLLSSMLEIYKEKIPTTLLKEHYRCHPNIINFCNHKYYNWELIPFTKETNSSPLIIFRTSPWNHMRDITNWQNTWKYNQRELDVIKDMLETKNEYLEDLSDIWIITPFRKQVEKANNILKKNYEVNTVHKFQWREKDTIIISTVLDDTKAWKLVMNFADNPNLINVAVSRAKNKLIIVTHNDLFFKSWKEIKDLVKYIEYSTLDKNIIESDIIWIFDLLYKNFSAKLLPLKEKVKKVSETPTEDIFYVFIKEILDDDNFSNIDFTMQVLLKNLIKNTSKLDNDEIKFINHNSSIDFLIFSKFWKEPVLAIEIDWIEYHENNPIQLERDKKKNSILNKYWIPCLRLATNWSWEKERVYNKLIELLNKDYE